MSQLEQVIKKSIEKVEQKSAQEDKPLYLGHTGKITEYLQPLQDEAKEQYRQVELLRKRGLEKQAIDIERATQANLLVETDYFGANSIYCYARTADCLSYGFISCEGSLYKIS